MEDEVFEKYYTRLHIIFSWEPKAPFVDYIERQKRVIKQILEEIESNAYEKAIKDFNDLTDGKISMKEANHDRFLSDL